MNLVNLGKYSRNPWLYVFPMACASALGQDVISTTLNKIDTSFVTYANILVVLGLVILGAKYVFLDRHDHGSTWTTILGACFLLGARALATFFLPTAAP